MINVVELDERINKCLSILDENPRSRIFAALAEAYRRRGDFGRAFSVCKSGLRIHTDYGAAHVVMAKLYLHQNMVDQARESLARAIEIDGPLRSTDLLMAEIHLLSAEFQEVRKILNRFALEGGEDQAVKNLRERLHTAEHGDEVTPPPSTARRPLSTASSQSAPDPAATKPHAAERQTICTDPGQAVTEIMRLPLVTYCAIYADNGTLLASRNASDAGGNTDESELVTPFAEIESLLGAQDWGRLSAIKMEDAQGQWGILRSEGMVAVIRGAARLSYAAAVRKINQCLCQIADHRTAESDSTVVENATERLPG